MHAKPLQSCLTLCDPMDCSPPGSSVHGDSPGKNTRVGCHVLLQSIFPTQVSWIASRFFTVSCQRSPGILEWVAYLFSRRSSQPRSQTRVSCIAVGFFTSWATQEAPIKDLWTPKSSGELGVGGKSINLWFNKPFSWFQFTLIWEQLWCILGGHNTNHRFSEKPSSFFLQQSER